MAGRRWVWAAVVTAWALFTFWYTNTAGPLSAEEVERYVDRYRSMNPDGDASRLRAFLSSDTGDQFLMVNLLDMADDPPDVEGAAPGESASQLLGRYMAHMYPALLRRACHPVYVGDAVAPTLDSVGITGAEVWTRAALVRYRSRRDMIDIATRPAFAGRHAFKLAALEKTIAFPVENVMYLADPRWLLALILLVVGAAVQWVLRRRTTAR